MIDEMSDEDFMDMMLFLINSEFDEFDDEFENPFSGEMVNFKCPNCKKISAYPIEIINDIMMQLKKNHKLIVITVIIRMSLQFTTNLLTEKYLKFNFQKTPF